MGKIIDISHYHPIKDWQKAKEQCSVLICKATEGTHFVDGTLKDFVKGCEEYKIPYFLYGFLRKGKELESVKFLISTCKDLVGPFFIGYGLDIEPALDKTTPTAEGTKKAVDYLAGLGGKLLVYTGYSQYDLYKNIIKGLPDNCSWWEARYTNKYSCHDGVDLWQYDSELAVDYAPGGVDVSRIMPNSKKQLDWYTTPTKKETVAKKEAIPVTDKDIKICGHGSGNPSIKNLNVYATTRYNMKANNGKRKGIVEVRRLKAMTDEGRKKFVQTYATIVGRNVYSQSLRDYVYTSYKGRYYSDCSSSGCATYRKIGYKVSNLNTAGIHNSALFETVPVEIEDGHIMNPEVLKVADAILFVGNDPSRPLQIGHVEYVYEMPVVNAKTTKNSLKTYTGAVPDLPTGTRKYYKRGDGMYAMMTKKNEIKKIQSFLNWYLDAELTVDGEYGTNTRNAVIKFQRKAGIKPDGVFGKDSLSKLKTVTK